MYEYFITPFSSLICGISLRRIKVKFNWSLKYLTISLWIYFDTSCTDEQKYNIQMLTGLDQPGNCRRTVLTNNNLLTRFFPCTHTHVCENFTLTSSVMVFPVRVFTKICMAPLENFLSNTKVLKDQSCRVSFVELCECGILKAQNYQ